MQKWGFAGKDKRSRVNILIAIRGTTSLDFFQDAPRIAILPSRTVNRSAF
jgi:hypothetical protein